MESGDFLSSRAVSSQVLSAFGVLTSVFGMGTGGTLQLLSPEIVFRFQVRGLASLSSRFPSFPPFRVPSLRTPRFRILKTAQDLTWLPQAQSFLSDPSVLSGLPTFLPLSDLLQDQALDLLVSPSSMRYRTSTDDLSTLSSSRGLTCL